MTVEECSRVPADAAGAGHVQVVLWCLDNGWEFTDSIVEAAAKEGRQNVVMALSERGFSCWFSVEEAAPPQMPGETFGKRSCTSCRVVIVSRPYGPGVCPVGEVASRQE